MPAPRATALRLLIPAAACATVLAVAHAGAALLPPSPFIDPVYAISRRVFIALLFAAAAISALGCAGFRDARCLPRGWIILALCAALTIGGGLLLANAIAWALSAWIGGPDPVRWVGLRLPVIVVAAALVLIASPWRWPSLNRLLERLGLPQYPPKRSRVEVLREIARLDPRCVRCRYSLRGLTTPICPECGAPQPRPSPSMP